MSEDDKINEFIHAIILMEFYGFHEVTVVRTHVLILLIVFTWLHHLPTNFPFFHQHCNISQVLRFLSFFLAGSVVHFYQSSIKQIGYFCTKFVSEGDNMDMLPLATFNDIKLSL